MSLFSKFNFKNFLIVTGSFFLLFILILTGIFLFNRKMNIQAAETHKLRGWGWSENVGWISMNCFNDFDNDGVFENCCPGGTECTSENTPYTQCCPYDLSADYGVNYDTISKELSGYAWAENIGWICFGKTCDGATPDGNNAWACVGNGSCLNGVCSCVGDQGEDFLDTDKACTESNHLKAHWKMNDIVNGKIIDETTVNGGTLMPAVAPPALTKGKFENALKFDGIEDYVEMADSPNLSMTGNLTIEAWVKRNEVGGEQTIVAKWDESQNKKSYRLWFSSDNRLNFTVSNNTNLATAQQKNGICVGSNRKQCYNGLETNEQSCSFHADCPIGYYCHEKLCDNDSNCDQDLHEICQNAPITDIKKWHHVVGKYVADIPGTDVDEKALLLFIDGSPAFVNITGTIPNALIDDSQNFYIGAKKGTTVMNTYFKGNIDNVSVWSCQNLGKILGRHKKEIWNDAKMEVDGWAKIVSLNDGGWLKLQGLTRDSRVWGSYLNNYNTFYTFSGYMANRYVKEPTNSSGLMAYWKMNEPFWNDSINEVIDSSINNNHGTAKNGAKIINNGALHNAGDFDGENDCLLIPDSPTLDIANSITLSIWILNEGPGSGNESSSKGMIISKNYAGNNGVYNLHLNYYTSGNKIEFEVYDLNDTRHYLESTTVVEDKKWYHVVAIYDYGSGKAKIYINGEKEENEGTWGGYNLKTTSLATSIGCSTSADNTPLKMFFSGLIDDVMIYNRVLSETEIKAIYNSSIPFCAGWEDHEHEYSGPPAPLDFDNLSLDNTLLCGQMSLQWESSDWAESYTYERCDNVSETECASCSYVEKSVLDDSCELTGCYLVDNDLIPNTGYCYKVQAHNETGSTYNSEGPVWKSTLFCAPTFGVIDNSVCGQLSLQWESIEEADGNNIYRSLTNNGCYDVYSPTCELIGHVAEGMNYYVNNDELKDLIAHWKMNESSWSGATDEVNDSSGNGNHGVASTGTTTTGNGKFDYAGVFDGNDYLTIGHHEQFDLGEDDKMTIEAWVYLNAAPTNYQMILSKGYNPGYEFRINTGRYAQFLNVATGYSSYVLTSTNALSLNEWYHLAVTKSNMTGETKIYINGVLDKTGFLDTFDYSNENEIRIGRDADDGCANGNAYFKGYLDNLAVYNAIKDEEQMRIDYEAGNCGADNCRISEVCNLCHVQGVDDGICGRISSDASVCCCSFTDSRIVPFVDYHYVFTVTSGQGESTPGPEPPLTSQTICFPPTEEEEN
ncbi:MAG: hypothetical protein PHW15_02315 [Patescibacteria group bacterium]|nr:hypothetical protein [Patescibacteria group bacterium]MDD5172826.1 hypothetical protein [Patescibacteria group bacterium]